MTNEDKQLLLRDLCARYPYDVMVKVPRNGSTLLLCQILEDNNFTLKVNRKALHGWIEGIEEVRPYLRPMSSMTEDEQRTLDSMCNGVEMVSRLSGLKMFNKAFDWLNKNMFDYRGLIEKGLALEAPEDMYKTEK